MLGTPKTLQRTRRVAHNDTHRAAPTPPTLSTFSPRRCEMSGDGAGAAGAGALQTLRDAANDAVHKAFTEGTSKRKRAAKDTTVG